MNSFKSMVWITLVLILLAALGTGVAYGVRVWQQHRVGQDLDLAQSYFAQGKTTQAEQILAELLKSSTKPSSPWSDRTLSLQFQVLEQLKDLKARQALVDQVLDPKRPWGQPGQECWARANWLQAQKAIDNNDAKTALEHINAILGQPEASWGRPEATLGLARIEMAKGDIKTARKQLIALLDNKTLLPESSPSRFGVEYALGMCNVSMLMSLEPSEGDEIYTLQKGDSLDKLKRKLRKEGKEVSPEVLMRVNQISDPRRLHIGQRVKIPNIHFKVVVNKTDNTLTLLNNDKFFKKYKVRTGQQDFMTPRGDFTIRNKLKDPPWRDPRENKSYGPGDPGNQLGSRWMEFQGSIGIHEAVDASTIGTYSSHGCVGMRKEDVEELYDLVPLGTPVKITGERSASVALSQ